MQITEKTECAPVPCCSGRAFIKETVAHGGSGRGALQFLPSGRPQRKQGTGAIRVEFSQKMQCPYRENFAREIAQPPKA